MIANKDNCSICERKAVNEMQPIGQSVRQETTFGRGSDRTTFEFYQCQECGAVWTQYKDGGAGGRGKFEKCLTDQVF